LPFFLAPLRLLVLAWTAHLPRAGDHLQMTP
jgi:hypothetical protein